MMNTLHSQERNHFSEHPRTPVVGGSCGKFLRQGKTSFQIIIFFQYLYLRKIRFYNDSYDTMMQQQHHDDEDEDDDAMTVLMLI